MSEFHLIQVSIMQLLIINKSNILKGATYCCLLTLSLLLSCDRKISSVQFVPDKIYEFYSPKYVGADRVFLLEEKNDTKIIHPQVNFNQIIINSLKSNKTDTIKIKSNLFWENYYYVNQDSIFLINRHNGIIYLINSKNELINNWKIPLLIDSVFYVIYIARQCDIVFKDNSLFLTVIGFRDNDYTYNYPISMIYNLRDKKVTKLFMKFPDNYSSNHHWSIMGSTFTNTFLSDDEIVYNFPMNEKVFKYSLKDNSVKTIILKKSKYINKFPPETFDNLRGRTESEYIYKYWIDKPSYRQIIFDKYRKLFYRIVNHEQPLKDSLNNYNDNFTRNWSIMVFDESFNFISEQFFEGKKYSNFYTFITKEGLLLVYDDKYKQRNNKMLYELFTIKIS